MYGGSVHDGGGVGGVDGNAAYDSDGSGIDVAALVSGMLDVLTSLASSSKFYRLLEPALADVMHAVIGLLQISPESEQQWDEDLSQYLQDEDPDSFAVSPRVAAQQAIDELLDAYGKQALPALLKAATARIEQATALRAQGDSVRWWRVREAALLSTAIAAPVLGQSAHRPPRGGGTACAR